MKRLKSCGVICFRRRASLEFLLMEHAHRLDWPKGHVLRGETELECALREFEEETGILRDAIRLIPPFRHEDTYRTRYRRFGGETVEKTVVLFLGWLEETVTVVPTEHRSHRWIEWAPPHQMQARAIDPALEAVDLFWQGAGAHARL
ncbi:MAG: dihydroneopterin triphosphate pyrophosphatase [Lentisphaerae bacterium ADurb.BinA184]|nr:MAG: dihydroneopterin triphosphate pyrophosphatase [Lentisphaerae bacterium ADurb.BinA184]